MSFQVRHIGVTWRTIGANQSLVDAGVFPELAGDLERVDTGRLPPGALIAGAVHGAMVETAERDREFIAGFAAERPRLHVSEMMRV